MGRRKVEMKRLMDNSSRQVTFSKRRSGLFKKANELATLCAARVAIIVFSPGGKPFSFGHPNVHSVVSQFTNNNNRKAECRGEPTETARRGGQNIDRAAGLNVKINDVARQLEAEKRRGKILERMIKKGGEKEVFTTPVQDELGLCELRRAKTSLERLRRSVRMHAREMEASSSLLLLAGSPRAGD